MTQTRYQKGLILLHTLFIVFFIGLAATALMSWYLFSYVNVHKVTYQFAKGEEAQGVLSRLLSCWKGQGPYCSATDANCSGTPPPAPPPSASCAFNTYLEGTCYTVTVVGPGPSYQLRITVPEAGTDCPPAS